MGSRQAVSHRLPDTDRIGSVSSHSKPIQIKSQSTSARRTELTASRGQKQYAVDISSRRQLHELQRLEQTHGQKVHEWLDEGMPREVMGTPAKMRAFRKQKETSSQWTPEGGTKQSDQQRADAAGETNPAGDGVAESVHDVISSSGQSLDGTVQRMMETRMGGSFGNVQVHTGATATTACESIDARAFTVGNHIAFNAGEYDPSSPAGQHVIAHELAHVQQQTGGAVSMLPQDGLNLEVDPNPQLEREAESTAQHVQGGERGIQRLKDTDKHVQQSTQLPIENPKVSKRFRSVANAEKEVISRQNRIKGINTDGTAMQPAVQQRGPSCLLAMLQAFLVTQGQDTTSFAQLLRNYPRDIETGGALNDPQTDVVSFIQKNPLGFAPETQQYLLETLATLEKPLREELNEDWRNGFQTKGIVSALGNVFQDKQKKGELATPEQKQHDEVLTTGKNLLKRAQKRAKGFYSMGTIEEVGFNDSMEALKENFMEVISKTKTPVLVSARGLYNPDFPSDNPIEDERPGHVIFLYGVRLDENDNAFVAYRNERDPDGGVRNLELNKFLAPLHKGTNETLKHKNSYSRDASKNSYSREASSITPFYIVPLSMEFEAANDQISKPTHTEDETDSDFYSVTDDESDLISEDPLEPFTEDVVRQFTQLASL